jgi:hypothetical protein
MTLHSIVFVPDVPTSIPMNILLSFQKIVRLQKSYKSGQPVTGHAGIYN